MTGSVRPHQVKVVWHHGGGHDPVSPPQVWLELPDGRWTQGPVLDHDGPTPFGPDDLLDLSLDLERVLDGDLVSAVHTLVLDEDGISSSYGFIPAHCESASVCTNDAHPGTLPRRCTTHPED